MKDLTTREPANDPQDLERLLVARENAGDVTGMTALFEPDAVVDIGGGTFLRGKEAIHEFLQKIGQKAPRLEPGDEWPSRRANNVDRRYTAYMDYQHEQHEQHSVHLVIYHVIWCPKRRRKVLVGPIRNRLEQIIREVAEEHDWTVIEVAIQPDHVHLFIRANPYTLPSDIPRLIKGRSSHDLRKEFPHLLKLPSLWTRSFFLSTAGNVSQETIRKYIERQSKT
jgi:REP-associated tyrosine transposase